MPNDDTTELRASVDSGLYDEWKGTLAKTDRIPEELERLMREDLGQ